MVYKNVSTVFQRCLRCEKKSCFAVRKGVSTVKKEVFPQWFYGDQKGVSTMLQRLPKKVVSTAKKVFPQCFYSHCDKNDFSTRQKKVVSTMTKEVFPQ